MREQAFAMLPFLNIFLCFGFVGAVFKANIFVCVFESSWPDHVPIFLHTASRQNAFHWTIISNLSYTKIPRPGLPYNVRVVRSDENDFFSRASKSTSVALTQGTLEKANAFKPLLGEMFPEFLNSPNSFSHWGWGDIDVILGNISSILAADQHPEDYDIICTDRVECLNKHLVIMKNTETTIKLHRKYYDSNLDAALKASSTPTEIEFQLRDMLKDNFLKILQNKLYFGASINRFKYWMWYRGNIRTGLQFAPCMLIHLVGPSQKQNFRLDLVEALKPFYDGEHHADPDALIMRSGRKYLLLRVDASNEGRLSTLSGEDYDWSKEKGLLKESALSTAMYIRKLA